MTDITTIEIRKNGKLVAKVINNGGKDTIQSLLLLMYNLMVPSSNG